MSQEYSAKHRAAVNMALGRIFRVMSRPAQPGDAEQYEAARRVVLDHLAPLAPEYRPNYQRDRALIVATGDAT